MGMKLATEIKPRADGTLKVDAVSGGVVYEFTPHPKDDGVMICDVRDDKTVAMLLSTGNFFPASEKDDERAEQILQSMQEQDAAAADDDAADPNAPLVEGEQAGA